MLEVLKTFFNCSILVISVYIFGIILFNNGKFKLTFKDIIAIIVCSALHTTAFILLKGTEKTILSMLSFALLIELSFNTGYIKSIFSSILYSLLTIIPDLMILGFVTQLLNVTKESCYSTFAGSILGNIIISMLMIGLTYALRKTIKKNYLAID
ncbi:MAG: hypothetical protein L6V91_00650 [Bacilli bacterium]|nr:MAG: hypothetical protein L6V91_00650 [Bacilli bacterium]